jgi:hypothetical protein
LIEDLTQEMMKTTVRDPEPVSTSDSLQTATSARLRLLTSKAFVGGGIPDPYVKDAIHCGK